MSKAGIYKLDVKKARDSLIAQGRHPSVDAVRVALGNTGSKTTIHKYLKELEAEDGGASGHQTSISEALQDLVERLAARLQDEANEQIDALRAEQTEKNRLHTAEQAASRDEIEQLRTQWRSAETALQQEQQAHARTREMLQKEEIARRTAEQHAADLRDRLTDKEAHCQSLEDKHRHAYEALEHYRQSVKEQRDQDQRRHEQQVQQLQAELHQARQTIVVKQEDITRLNQEGARLVAELTHARGALHEAQESTRRVTQRLKALQAVEQRNGELTAQLVEREAHVQTLRQQLAGTTEKTDNLAVQVRDLELALAQAQAKTEAQQGIVAELHAYFDTSRSTTGEARQPSP